MATTLRNIWSNWSNSKFDYSHLQKKDDNIGIEEALEWVRNHSLPCKFPKDLKNLETVLAKDLAEDIIKSLKKFPIHSGNEEIIKTRIIEFCQWNCTISSYVISHFLNLKGDPEVLKSIQFSLIMRANH